MKYSEENALLRITTTEDQESAEKRYERYTAILKSFHIIPPLEFTDFIEQSNAMVKCFINNCSAISVTLLNDLNRSMASFDRPKHINDAINIFAVMQAIYQINWEYDKVARINESFSKTRDRNSSIKITNSGHQVTAIYLSVFSPTEETAAIAVFESKEAAYTLTRMLQETNSITTARMILDELLKYLTSQEELKKSLPDNEQKNESKRYDDVEGIDMNALIKKRRIILESMGVSSGGSSEILQEHICSVLRTYKIIMDSETTASNDIKCGGSNKPEWNWHNYTNALSIYSIMKALDDIVLPRNTIHKLLLELSCISGSLRISDVRFKVTKSGKNGNVFIKTFMSRGIFSTKVKVSINQAKYLFLIMSACETISEMYAVFNTLLAAELN